jgi:hypothetical protein
MDETVESRVVTAQCIKLSSLTHDEPSAFSKQEADVLKAEMLASALTGRLNVPESAMRGAGCVPGA